MVKKKKAGLGIKSGWNRLLNLGVQQGVSPLEVRKIRLLNSILIIGEFIFFTLLIKSYLQGLDGEVYPQLIGAILFAIPLMFNFMGKYNTARMLCILIPYSYLCGLAIYWGESRGSQLIIYGAAPLAILFFENKRVINSLFVVGMVVLLAAHILSWNIDQYYISPSERVSFLLNLTITAVLIYVIFNIFKSQNYNYQQELSAKNKSITDSIHYAGRIQSSILGDPSGLEKLISSSFVFYRPKDIVSGDFYWFSEKTEKKVVVASDCTGHGVPGAFMTVLGNSLLNEIINEKEILDPKTVLEQLDEKVRTTLQGNENIKSEEGMDMGMLVIDEKQGQIKYGGANHTLYYVRDGELHSHKSTKSSIGGSMNSNGFETVTIDSHTADTYYLASDGFQDQFNMDGKKYMRSNFRNFLLELSKKPIHEQQQVVDQEFVTWKGDEPQTDDVLIIGIRI